MKQPLKILHLEDLPEDAVLVKRELEKGEFRFEFIVVDNAADFSRAIQDFNPDIILSDHSMPSFSSIEALRLMRRLNMKIPLILVTAAISEEFAVDIMKLGAYDYVLKDRLQRLPQAILNALEKAHIENERQQYLNKVIANEAMLKVSEKLALLGSWQLDLVNRHVQWSDEFYRLLAYNPEETAATFDNFMKRVFHEDVDELRKSFEEVRDDPGPQRHDFRLLLPDGSIKHIRSEFIMEKDEGGRPLRIIGFSQDVSRSWLTEQSLKRSEQDLKRSNERYKLATKATNDII